MNTKLVCTSNFASCFHVQFSGAPSKFTTVDVAANDNTDTGVVQETHIQYEFPWGQDTVEILRNYGNSHIARLQDESGISHEVQTTCKYSK